MFTIMVGRKKKRGGLRGKTDLVTGSDHTWNIEVTFRVNEGLLDSEFTSKEVHSNSLPKFLIILYRILW